MSKSDKRLSCILDLLQAFGKLQPIDEELRALLLAGLDELDAADPGSPGRDYLGAYATAQNLGRTRSFDIKVNAKSGKLRLSTPRFPGCVGPQWVSVTTGDR